MEIIIARTLAFQFFAIFVEILAPLVKLASTVGSVVAGAALSLLPIGRQLNVLTDAT